MNFGQALEALKEGKKVAREGWNGKGMFLYLVNGSRPHSEDLRGECATHILPLCREDAVVKINSHIDMKAADDSIVIGWLASQTDMLAEDWEVIK